MKSRAPEPSKPPKATIVEAYVRVFKTELYQALVEGRIPGVRIKTPTSAVAMPRTKGKEGKHG